MTVSTGCRVVASISVSDAQARSQRQLLLRQFGAETEHLKSFGVLSQPRGSSRIFPEPLREPIPTMHISMPPDHLAR